MTQTNAAFKLVFINWRSKRWAIRCCSYSSWELNSLAGKFSFFFNEFFLAPFWNLKRCIFLKVILNNVCIYAILLAVETKTWIVKYRTILMKTWTIACFSIVHNLQSEFTNTYIRFWCWFRFVSFLHRSDDCAIDSIISTRGRCYLQLKFFYIFFSLIVFIWLFVVVSVVVIFTWFNFSIASTVLSVFQFALFDCC